MSFEKTLKKIIVDVNTVLDEELNKITPYARTFSKEVSHFWDQAFPLWSQGKRLRAAMVIIGHQFFNGTLSYQEVLKVAAGIELIHSYILVHDDIMDRAETRRGVPTINEFVKNMYSHESENVLIGNSVAICFGDIFCHLGLKLINSIPSISSETIVSVNKIINNCIVDTGFGQIMDYMNAYKQTEPDEIAKVYELKTGRYTYEMPLFVGATLAKANQEQITTLSKYAIPGGIAFQIIDDIIGTFGDEEITGKSTASDLIEGKQTFLVLETMNRGNQTERLSVANVLGKKDASPLEIKQARDAIISSGALQIVRNKARVSIEKSNAALQQISSCNSEAKALLEDLNQFVLDRDK